jgi:hypothetical protein
MPSKSKKQHNLMAAVANNPAFAKKVGISKSVGEEFMKADKTKKFRNGDLVEVDSDKNPGLSKLPTEVRNKMGYMKKGGMAKKMAKGGCATKSDAKMIAKKEVKGHESSMHKMKKGGIVEKGTGEKYASKAAMMKHEKKETKAEEMKEHKMKKGGMCGYASGGKVSQLAKSNGIAKQGKTKGRII